MDQELMSQIGMGWKLFGQIVLLLLINAFVKNFVKCLHDTYCAKCKK
jgi:hypothetical protein